jgi:hypothetical protein
MFPFFHVLRFFTFELTSSTRSHLFSMPLSNSLRLHVRIQFRSHSDVTVQLTSSFRVALPAGPRSHGAVLARGYSKIDIRACTATLDIAHVRVPRVVIFIAHRLADVLGG